MLWKGFKFGMILQMAIGPICMFVLNTALSLTYFHAEMAVLGTVLTDGAEIVLAIIGVGIILDKNVLAKKIMKIFGVLVLLIYGISSILAVFDISVLPSIYIPYVSENTFLQAILLALSNPLTVVFWASIFSAKILEDNMQSYELYLFATGCVLATFVFLTAVAVMGTVLNTSIPNVVIKALNVAVGIMMLIFAYRNSKIEIS